MRAVVFSGNRKIDFLNFDDPTPGPGEVVLEIKASGLCGSDLKYYRAAGTEGLAALGLKLASGPMIAGHEPCGVVAALGPNVDPKSWKVGDRVMVHHYYGCTVCPNCRTGWTQMCVEGATIYGANGHGSHAPHMKVPAATLVHLPSELSFATGAAISCGTGTAYGALVRIDVSARDTIAVFGQGPVGLSVTQLAAAMGARVIAVDISAERVARAKDFGATDLIDASKVDPVAAIKDLTKGRGLMKTIDASGSSAGRSGAIRSAAQWGVVCFVGEGGDVTIDVSPEIMRKQLTIVGSWTFSTVGQADCARFVADRGLAVDDLFTETWKLDQATEAYELFDRQTSGKAVFLM
jgi:threonine dehydrogenase-like Zn-dependent dehydrogenase